LNLSGSSLKSVELWPEYCTSIIINSGW
jgi:hypothetical protein